MIHPLRNKKSILLIAVVLAFVLCGLFQSQAAAADQLRVPKIISIVYDDSSSMSSGSGQLGKAGYANYAVKVFLSLLDTDDIVYVIFMSNPFAAYKLDMQYGQAQAIAQMNSLIGQSMTPFQAVATAMDALKSVPSSDVSVNYWLVVFTDGAFQDMRVSGMESELSSFLHTSMPNGTLPQGCFVSIGADAQRPETAIDGLSLYPASGAITKNEDILQVMRSMADRISGRVKLGDQSITASGNTVTFTTDLPCFSFAFLQQLDLYPWTALTDSAGKQLTGSFVQIETASMLESISGWASKVVPEADQVLPAGTYTLTFREPPQDLVIMIEPALVLDLNVTAAGTEDSDSFAIFSAGKVDVKGFLHFWHETDPIEDSLLPSNTAYSLKATQNGQTVREDQSASMTLSAVDVAAETLFTGTVELPNIGVVTANRKISLPAYTLQLQQEGSATYPLNELVGSNRGLTVTILRDGVPLDAADAAALSLVVETDAPHTVTRQSDGTFRILPQLDRLRPLSAYGELPITITLESAGGSITPSVASWTFLPPDIQVHASLLGTNTVARTMLRGSAGLLTDAQSLSDLAAASQEHVIAAFTVSVNGQQLTGDELADWQPITITLSENLFSRYACGTKSLADGTLLAVPCYVTPGLMASDLLQWTDSWHLPPLSGSVTCTVMNNSSASQAFTIVMEPWYLLVLNIVLPLLIFVWLLGYVFKRRFPRKAAVRWIPFQRSNGRYLSSAESWREESLRRVNFWSFIPYATSRAKVGGLKFFAGTPGSVLIPLASLPAKSQLIAKKNCSQRGVFSCDPEDKELRPVYLRDFEVSKNHRCALADNDILLFTGDGRSGRAFSYTRD